MGATAIGIFAWISRTASSQKIGHLAGKGAALLILAQVISFPIVVRVGAAWGVSPCLACVIYWASAFVLAYRIQLLGRYRFYLIGATLMLAAGALRLSEVWAMKLKSAATS